MSWREGRASLITETVLVGWKLFARDAPWRLVFTSFWVRSIAECFLFTGLGYVGGGQAGGDFAFVGAVVLTAAFYSVALATDVPLRDRWDGTYPRLAMGRIPSAATFFLRCTPQIVHAVIAAGVAMVVVGSTTGRFWLVLDLLPILPLIVFAAFSGVAVGLCVVSPALGTRLDVVTYNVAISLIVVCSGAVIPPGQAPLLDAIGQWLPMTHTIAAFRSYLAGSPVMPHIGYELIVGAVWAIAAVCLIAALQKRGRVTGRGNFST